MPGYIRIDAVHQGVLSGHKRVHHILGTGVFVGVSTVRLIAHRHLKTPAIIALAVAVAYIVIIVKTSISLMRPNIGITLDTYGHVLPDLQKTAAKRFDEVLEQKQITENVSKMLAKTL